MNISQTGKNIITISWFFFILALISFPMETYPDIGPAYSDKIAHFFLFGIFAFLLAVSLDKYIKDKTKCFITSAGAAFAYSGICEIIQIYVPGRSESIYDLLAGGAGIIFFLAILYAIKRK